MITEHRIGETAGKIWTRLEEREELAISKIPEIVDKGVMITYLALGWLAREGKLSIRSVGNKTLVSLSERE